MRLLSSTDLGLKILLYMASKPNALVMQRELCDCFDVAMTSLKRPFQVLLDNKIVASRIGRQGGYFLMRLPKTITLEEVVKLLETDFHLIPLEEAGREAHPNSSYLFAFHRAREAFFHELSRFTIAELAGDPFTLEALGIPTNLPNASKG